jgi:hypothetical protein
MDIGFRAALSAAGSRAEVNICVAVQTGDVSFGILWRPEKPSLLPREGRKGTHLDQSHTFAEYHGEKGRPFDHRKLPLES